MTVILLLVGVSSGFAHSVYSAVSKSLLKNRIAEPFLLFLYISFFQAIASPIIWFFVNPAFPSREAWIPLLLAGGTCVVAYLFLYLSLSCGDVSSVMPILGSKVLFSGFLAILMLKESHNWQVYCAAILVAVSIAMLTYSPSRARDTKFPLKPIVLMVACSIVFAFTDIYIRRSLVFLDSYNFMVYYNFIVGIGSFSVIPYIRKRKVSLALGGQTLLLSLVSSIALVAATLLFVISFKIAHGVVVPNILMSTRGIFIVIISAVLAHRGSAALEKQSGSVYLLRFVASTLIVFAIWITLGN